MEQFLLAHPMLAVLLLLAVVVAVGLEVLRMLAVTVLAVLIVVVLGLAAHELIGLLVPGVVLVPFDW